MHRRERASEKERGRLVYISGGEFNPTARTYFCLVNETHAADNSALRGYILGISEIAAWVLKDVISGISGMPHLFVFVSCCVCYFSDAHLCLLIGLVL